VEQEQVKSNTSLENIINTAVRLPGIKVNRDIFLHEQFSSLPMDKINIIISEGPIKAGCSKSELRRKASKLILNRTLVSTGASFLAGLPGGIAMTATIPADMLQFYAVALRLAQEIAYLYGEGDLWAGDILDTEKVNHQLIQYCGVMLGASGASQAVRVLSSRLAQQALKKLPQKALTKTFYYPIVKSIVKTFGGKMTKEVFAKGVSKAVPIIGGVVSGGITFATLRPMANRLADTMEEAHFSYSQSDFETDWNTIIEINKTDEKADSQLQNTGVSETEEINQTNDVLKKIQDAKQMLEQGIITDEEFSAIKAKLIAKI
jgi:hypothetical protein